MIVVVANYRTGSSTLIRKLYKETGLRYYKKYTGEWCHKANGGFKPPHPGIQLYKIMPDQAEADYEAFQRMYLNVADKVYFCVRRNVREQINSFIYSLVYSYWHPGDKLPNREIILTNEEVIGVAKESIVNNLKVQRMWYRTHGGEFVFLEDREDKQKYDSPDCLTIPHYDLEIEDAEKFLNE